MGTSSATPGLMTSFRGSQTESNSLGLSKEECVLSPIAGVLFEVNQIIKSYANDDDPHPWMRATKLGLPHFSICFYLTCNHLIFLQYINKRRLGNRKAKTTS